jgi:TRAP-type C4-dicarboxylate transport system substrate-binding protein
MLKFKEVVEAESSGRIEIDLYPDSKLGDIAGLLTRLQDGSVDMALLGISTAADVKGGSALNIGALPFLYKDRKWVAKISNGPIYQQIFDDFAKESNIRIFASYGERLPRAFQTVRGPVRVPSDLKGMRIRVAPIDIYVETNKAFGAVPVRADINVTYELFKNGSIDGQENGIELALPLKLYEVAKYFTEVDYAPSLATWYSTETVWKSLTPADKEIFIKAAKAGGEVITGLSKTQAHDGIEKLKAEGVIVTQPDTEAFREAVKDIYKRYEGKSWPNGLVAKIKALQEQQ